jgi:6-phosphogluconolactonase
MRQIHSGRPRRMAFLRIAMLGLPLIFASGCGGGTTPVVKTPPTPSCVPASPPAHAYVLNGFSADTISIYNLNSCSGDLTPATPASVATGGNEFGSEGMVVDHSGKFAYVANLESNATDLATISMYTINPGTGILTPTTPATVPTGFFPQGIAIDPLSRFVYTANSDDNSVSMFTINPGTGVLTPATPPTVAAGWSPGFVTVDPSARFVYVTNQDDDTVSMYTINASTGVLTPMTPPTVPTGLSPFGLTVDPSGKFAYVPNPYDFRNIVSQYTIDPTTGVLTPNSPSFVTAGSQPSWIAVDPSSTFAYVTNRAENTVSIFKIDPNTGNLGSSGTAPTGNGPYPVTIDPSGHFVYVANEQSGTVSIYTIDGGSLLPLMRSTATGGPPVSISVTLAAETTK